MWSGRRTRFRVHFGRRVKESGLGPILGVLLSSCVVGMVQGPVRVVYVVSFCWSSVTVVTPPRVVDMEEICLNTFDPRPRHPILKAGAILELFNSSKASLQTWMT